jgi:D-alanine-D-alanine ligase
MKIGLTYDLRSEYLAAGYGEEETAEFDRDDTIEALERTLTGLGHETERIGHARSLIEELAVGRRWDLVFNIAEGLHGIGREAQVPAILDVYGIPYTFSDPLVMALTLHKGMTKHVLRDAGVPTSDFVVVAEPEDLHKVSFEPPYFIKPVAEGTGKGVTPDSIVRLRKALGAACRNLMAAFRQPVIVEPFLSGREFTIGIVGTGSDARVLGTMEVDLLDNAEAEVYSYTNKERCEELVVYRRVDASTDPVVQQAEAIVLDAWRVLGCRDGGRADVRCDSRGAPQFMEVNPLAGLHPEHSDLPILCTHLGISYAQLIEWILQSAQKRIRRNTTPERSQAHANRRRS